MKQLLLFLGLTIMTPQNAQQESPEVRRVHHNQLYAPISAGELFDKITILEIKRLRIQDQNQLHHIEAELDALSTILCASIDITTELTQLKQALLHVNEELWDTEDAIRIKETKKEFDSVFIELARQVYHLNDRRSLLKKSINQLTGSIIVEEKSYPRY